MSCPNCNTLRENERNLEKYPYSLGRCDDCTTNINKQVPRCFFCEINPGPLNKKLACRGCIRKMRRFIKKHEQEYEKVVEEHTAWVLSLSMKELTNYSSRMLTGFDGATKLDPPEYTWDFPFNKPITNLDVSNILREHTSFFDCGF